MFVNWSNRYWLLNVIRMTMGSKAIKNFEKSLEDYRFHGTINPE